MTQPYADAAPAYRSAGWLGVLPLPSRAKWWPPVGFTGRRDHDPDDAQVQRWCRERPEANIALRMPADVLGIDVDDYDGKPGAATLSQREAEWGELPPTWRVGSREGVSGIRLYRVPTQMAWPGIVGPGIETIHRGHRYAVVAPSVHPSGAVYRWIAPDGTEDGFTVPRPEDLTDLPDAWIVGLTGGRFADPASPKADADPEEVRAALAEWRTSGPACRQVATLYEKATEVLDGSGSRHDGIRDLLLPLMRLGQTGHAGVGWATDAVEARFVEAIGSTRSTESEARAEYQRMLLGAVLIVLADLRGAEECDGTDCHHDPLAGLAFDLDGTIIVDEVVADVPLSAEVSSQQALELQRKIGKQALAAYVSLEAHDRAKRAREAMNLSLPPSTFDGVEYLAQPDQGVTWVVKNLLPAGGNATLIAPFKTGKTTLVGELVGSLCDDRPFMGRFDVMIGGRVGLFNYELSTDQQKRWLADLGIEHPDRFSVWDLRGYRMPLTSPAVEKIVVEWLRKRSIEVWIIDPFARAFVGCGDENSNADVSTFLDTVDVIKRKAGVSCVVMPTHTGREQVAEGAEKARGATRLDDWPDVRWLLTRGDGPASDTRYFRATGRDVEVKEEALGFDSDTRRLHFGGASRFEDRRERIAHEVIEAVYRAPGSTRNDIEDLVVGRSSDVRREIERAVELGRISRRKRAGRGGGWEYHPPSLEVDLT